jgi:hypothetical protein
MFRLVVNRTSVSLEPLVIEPESDASLDQWDRWLQARRDADQLPVATRDLSAAVRARENRIEMVRGK